MQSNYLIMNIQKHRALAAFVRTSDSSYTATDQTIHFQSILHCIAFSYNRKSIYTGYYSLM